MLHSFASFECRIVIDNDRNERHLAERVLLILERKVNASTKVNLRHYEDPNWSPHETISYIQLIRHLIIRISFN